jgi:phosphoglycerol transferase MdoB-like AlkP superfamily enzyme
MADRIGAGDLIALAAIIIGFGSTIIAFRIQREVAMDEKGERLWVPWADWLVLLAIALCVAFVIFLLARVTPCRIAFASAAGASAIVLEAGYIPSILAHYRILFGKDRTKQRLPRERGEPAEMVFVTLTVVLAVIAFAFVHCQQR